MPDERTLYNSKMIGPLYIQISEILRSRILDPRWPTRTPLPGEHALAEEFGVSTGTIRKALDRLVHQGLISRKQGRGTFPTRRGTDNAASSIIWKSGAPFHLKFEVLGVDWVLACSKARREMEISKRKVTRITRRSRSDAADVHETIFSRLGTACFTPTSISNAYSFESIYEREVGATVARVTNRISRCSSAADVCSDDPRSCSILLERAYYDRSNSVLEYRMSKMLLKSGCLVLESVGN